MQPIPLSPETERRLVALFRDSDVEAARRLLESDCGSNLPFHENATPTSLERIRFAALKESQGNLRKLDQAIRLAQIDWRDLLMNADFGHDVKAHERWFPSSSER